MHLDDERIQRILHDELRSDDRAAAHLHLESCADCQGRLEIARGEERRVLALLDSIDHERPPVDPTSLLRAARSARERQRSAVRWRWAAAAIVVLALAGAAYAIPQSPLRAWVDRLIGKDSSAPSVTSESPSLGVPLSGLSVTPGPRFTIRFPDLGSTHDLIVTIARSDEVQVRAAGDKPSFVTDAEGLSIRPGANTSFEIDLPQSAPWIDILAGDRSILRKEGAEIHTVAPVDSNARYHLRIAPSSR